MKNAVIYARFYNDRMSEMSVQSQIDCCEQYAKQHKYNIVGQYVDVNNTSELKKMLKDTKKKNFQVIIVYQLDSFSQNKFESMFYKIQLENRKVQVIETRKNVNDDDTNVLMQNMLQGMIEYFELENKKYRNIKEIGDDV